MNTRLLLSIAVVATLAMTTACGGGDQSIVPAKMATGPVEPAALVTRVEALELPVTEQPKNASARSDASSAMQERPAAHEVRLPPMARQEKDRAAGVRDGSAPPQIGVPRNVPMTADSAGTRRAMKWHRSSKRTAAAISFVSEGSAGIRLGVLVHKLPAEALVRGYVQGGATAFEVKGSEILDLIRQNRDAGDLSDEGRTYWTPVVDSHEVTLEIVLPPGYSDDSVDISVPRLSHLEVKTSELDSLKVGEAAVCHIDVNCMAGFDNQSRATARMVYTKSGGTYLCSGTLLNNTQSDGIPYFLSANHCISTQTVASTLNTYWFYRSATCNSSQLSGSSRTLSGGATLLYASSATDTSFMKLNGTPPAGVVYAAWTSGAPSDGADVVGIHHPRGDLQKFSGGAVSGFRSCTESSTGWFNCTVASQSTGRFLATTWNTGTTEAGSSGSGLFVAFAGSRYLAGQLSAGSASCTNRTGTDAYGRFDIAYEASLKRWLSPAAPVASRTAIYRFYNATTGAHFFTPDAAERDWVVVTYPAFKYEGVAFYAYGAPIAGASPVFRFYNINTGRHFYTIGADERDHVIATYPEFKYEGISWYAQAANGGDANAIYRFYNDTVGTHFYTISADEKDFVTKTYPAYRFEGVGYYAWTTQ